MSFRENLQYLRGTRSMTQEQLAMLLGVSRQAISKWESEKAYPEMDKLLMICDLFGVTLDDLVMGDVRRPNSAPMSPFVARTVRSSDGRRISTWRCVARCRHRNPHTDTWIRSWSVPQDSYPSLRHLTS